MIARRGARTLSEDWFNFLTNLYRIPTKNYTFKHGQLVHSIAFGRSFVCLSISHEFNEMGNISNIPSGINRMVFSPIFFLFLLLFSFKHHAD